MRLAQTAVRRAAARRIFRRLVLECALVKGAPIYLVSACTSGDEFVAAFRRYADKGGLFIPIGHPVPQGRRGRFAVTLADGGVMVEGEAEVVSSARTASVLHGRVGMTLRFLETDDASRTILGELERARLAMRPPRPSVAPRPAAIPAEPRAVPPPIQGRIDATNALAECIAIGDLEALSPAAVAAPGSRTSPRFIVPTIPSSASVLAAEASPAVARTPTSPLPIAIAPLGSPGDVTPPATTPRASPLPARLRIPTPAPASHRGEDRVPPGFELARTPRGAPAPQDALAASEPMPPPPEGPRSDTIIVALPPVPTIAATDLEAAPLAPPPRTITRPGPAAMPVGGPSAPSQAARDDATGNAVPLAAPGHASAPTEIGGVIVMSTDDDLLAAPDSSPARPGRGPIDLADEPDSRTQIHAGAPIPAGIAAELHAHAHAPREVIDLTQTLRSPPPEMLELRAAAIARIDALRASGIPTTGAPAPGWAAASGPERGALGRPPSIEVEIGEPTDLSMPPVAPAPGARANDVAEPDPRVARPRATVIGVAVSPPREPAAHAALLTPATAAADEPTGSDAALVAEDEPTGHDASPIAGDQPPGGEAALLATHAPTGADRIVVEDGLVTPAPLPRSSPVVEEPTPSGDWMMAPGELAGVPRRQTETPAESALPSGDWLISLDPRAPDGWSAPLEVDRAAPAAHAPAVVTETRPLDAVPHRPTPRPDELLVLEPSVQVDPTLIEPLQIDARLRPMPPDIPGYAPAGYATAAFLGPDLPHHPGHPAGYPFEAGFPVTPAPGTLPPGAPGLYTAGGSNNALDAGRYSRPLPMAPRSGQRRAIIVIASALVAVAIGAGLLFARSAKRDARPTTPREPTRTGLRDAASRAAAPERAPVPAPADEPSGAAPPAAPAVTAAAGPPTVAPGDEAPGTVRDPAAPARPAVASAQDRAGAPCFVAVTSQPAGAEIVADKVTVLGTTPARLTLPCGAPIELVIRKARSIAATRTVTPTVAGARLKVALARAMFLVKVNSSPPGATITLNGKSLGVTPTTIKIPAFEASILTIAKDGYAPEAEPVAPRSNGISVHASLRKLERREPR
jgi:PEGA domain